MQRVYSRQELGRARAVGDGECQALSEQTSKRCPSLARWRFEQVGHLGGVVNVCRMHANAGERRGLTVEVPG